MLDPDCTKLFLKWAGTPSAMSSRQAVQWQHVGLPLLPHSGRAVSQETWNFPSFPLLGCQGKQTA